jgi:SPP1 family predicted phage head-tail adaptor
MRAGMLRHRVTVVRRIEGAKDAVGTPTYAWTDMEIDVPAHVRPLSGSELLAAQQVNASTTHEVRMRYGSDITARDRLTFDGRTLEIDAPPINVDERNRELVLRCHELEAKDDA